MQATSGTAAPLTFGVLRIVCFAMIAGVFVMGILGSAIFPGVIEPTTPWSEAFTQGLRLWMIFAVLPLINIPSAVALGVVFLRPMAGWSYQGGVLRREPMVQGNVETVDQFASRVKQGLLIIITLCESFGVFGFIGLLVGMPILVGLGLLGISLISMAFLLMQVGEYERFVEELKKVKASSAEDS